MTISYLSIILPAARVRAYEKAVLGWLNIWLTAAISTCIPSNCAFVVARVIYSYMQMFSSIRSEVQQHAEEICKVIHLLKGALSHRLSKCHGNHDQDNTDN